MEATMKDDLFDDELCGLVKFTDATATAQKPVETAKKSANKEPIKEKKTVQKSAGKPMDAEYEPVANSWLDSPEIKCVAQFLFFAGIEYVVFYWLQTGQMELSAAMPSMIVCAFLAGLSLKKNWKWSR